MMPLLQERMEHKQREKLRRFNWDLEVSRTRWHDFQFERHDVYNLWLLTNIDLIICLYIYLYLYIHTHILAWREYIQMDELWWAVWRFCGKWFGSTLLGNLWRLVEKSELRNQGKMPFLGSQKFLFFDGNVPSGKVKFMKKNNSPE